jgi:hypothetical protein
MAEPVDRQTSSLRVSREFSACRVEDELRVKVYGLLVPAIREFVGPLAGREDRQPARYPRSGIAREKGV